jgi:hypothetical protein
VSLRPGPGPAWPGTEARPHDCRAPSGAQARHLSLPAASLRLTGRVTVAGPGHAGPVWRRPGPGVLILRLGPQAPGPGRARPPGPGSPGPGHSRAGPFAGGKRTSQGRPGGLWPCPGRVAESARRPELGHSASGEALAPRRGRGRPRAGLGPPGRAGPSQHTEQSPARTRRVGGVPARPA